MAAAVELQITSSLDAALSAAQSTAATAQALRNTRPPSLVPEVRYKTFVRQVKPSSACRALRQNETTLPGLREIYARHGKRLHARDLRNCA